MSDVDRLMELLWPQLRLVTGMGGRTQYWNIEETRSFCQHVLRKLQS